MLQRETLFKAWEIEGRADSLMGKNANAKNRTFMLS